MIIHGIDVGLFDRLEKDHILRNSRITTIISGGMDSATLLYFAVARTSEENVLALSFDYGQKHKKELDFARNICKELGVKHKVVELHSLTELLYSSLTSDEAVPHGHYAEDNMKSTVVPNRNAIMLAMAYGAAISHKSDYLLYGAHTGDHFIYPDCRPEFVESLNLAFRIGNQGFGDVEIKAPFSKVTKSEIVTYGLTLNVPYDKTWSCYEGGDKPCLQCGTCIERYESFKDNAIQDPLLTEAEWELAGKYYSEALAKQKES
jgi:7-cyano-7-deazaguanine synthase